MNATEAKRAAARGASPQVSEPAELESETVEQVGLRRAVDNAQTGALALRDFLNERLPQEPELWNELRAYLAAARAQHEELLGEVTDSARLLELSCDWFSGWAGSKLGQF